MLNLRLPQETFAALKVLADSEGMSVAAYIAKTLNKHIN